jgi:uncharacterized protein YegJ (DUF2314 family)
MGMERVLSRRAAAVLGLGLAALLLGGCFRAATPTPSPTRSHPGSLFAERASFRLVLFHLPRPAQSIPPLVPELLRQRFPSFHLINENQEAAGIPAMRVLELPVSDYPLPPGEWMELAARGLTPREQAGLASSELVTVLEFHTVPPALEAMRQAHLLALELARTHGGLLWDEEAGEFFSPEGLRAWRLDGWVGGEPLMERHFNSLFLQEEDHTARLVTAGLMKFGLPELEMRHIPGAEVSRAGMLINLVAQLLLEGTPVSEGGRLQVSIDALQYAPLREQLQRGLGRGATGGIVLALTPSESGEEAEEEGPLLELLFPESPGAGAAERRHAAMLELFGASYDVTPVEHDEELLAVSHRALDTLLVEVKPRFLRGLEQGERLFVKARFDTSAGGTEWMWVRVLEWKGQTLSGVLDSDPEDVPGLRSGSPVAVEEEALFDYLLARPDGSFEGNQTESLILERGAGW